MSDPAADEHYVRTSPFTPTVKTSWDFIQVHGKTPTRHGEITDTALQVRIHDGTAARYWDGAAWTVPTTALHWNDLATLNANLSTYTGVSLAIEIRFITTYSDLTPWVARITLRWTGLQVNMPRAVTEAIITSMRPNLRPVVEIAFTNFVGGTSIVLTEDAYKSDARYEWADACAVYDHTADPAHATNLLSSYDVGPQTISLSSPIPAGNTAWLVMLVEPLVAATTSEDFDEDQRVPSVHITGINFGGARMSLGVKGPWVVDTTLPIPAGTVHLIPIPFRDVFVALEYVAPSTADLTSIIQAVNGWMEAHRVFSIPQLGLDVPLRPMIPADWLTGPAVIQDLRRATAQFILERVPMFGSRATGAASDGGSATIGPVDAGDAAYPGVGYGVARGNLQFLQADGTGDETVTVEE